MFAFLLGIATGARHRVRTQRRLADAQARVKPALREKDQARGGGAGGLDDHPGGWEETITAMRAIGTRSDRATCSSVAETWKHLRRHAALQLPSIPQSGQLPPFGPVLCEGWGAASWQPFMATFACASAFAAPAVAANAPATGARATADATRTARIRRGKRIGIASEGIVGNGWGARQVTIMSRASLLCLGHPYGFVRILPDLFPLKVPPFQLISRSRVHSDPRRKRAGGHKKTLGSRSNKSVAGRETAALLTPETGNWEEAR